GGRPRLIAAVAEHRVDRVEPLTRPTLRALALQRDPRREHVAGGGEPAGGGDGLRRDEVERADLVVGAPATPVPHLHHDLAESLLAHGGHLTSTTSPKAGIVSAVAARTDRLLLANAFMGLFLTVVASRIFIISLPTFAAALVVDIHVVDVAHIVVLSWGVWIVLFFV